MKIEKLKIENWYHGFTLIELITAIAIFSIIIVITSGVYSRFVSNQRRDIAYQQLQEDTRLSLEMFNREARTGYGSTYDTYSDNNSSVFSFRNQNRSCVYYRTNPDQDNHPFQRAEVNADPASFCSDAYAEIDSWQTMTDDTTVFDEVTFKPHPAVVTGNRLTNQGLVTILFTVHSAGQSQSALHLQNTVASRQVNPFRP
ncbi:MAG: prepilin-type N-terminal cleavage/methylation domain-containing protein [bacterium]|nr:prepilin-type N-terminal cleavage/methylation domain-containing protein [bacterium]MDZ4346532.1 prepilin-type N-terminal cleavage/methylation domain-containing protein [Candidatus Binatia bacterium]